MSELNVPLLRKAVEWVEEQAALGDAGNWCQDSWVVPAETHAFRIATDRLRSEGWSEVAKLAAELEPSCGTTYCVAGYVAQMHEPTYQQHEFLDGVHVAHYAADLLGLDEREADRLFHAHNAAEDVRRIAEEIAGERL